MLTHRPRRLRSTALIRNLVHEVDLNLSQLVQPYFLSHNPNAEEPIAGFSGVFRWGINRIARQVGADRERGVRSFLLFGAAADGEKDPTGSIAAHPNSQVAMAARELKKQFGDDILLFSDVCLCPYTSHGHCGIVKEERVENDASLKSLAEMALVHAESGVDFVAPSDMMDGRVGAIRQALDKADYSEVGILAYTAKYASNYYGPFREALGSSPQGAPKSERLRDRATYQMDYRNREEAFRELESDLAEGADLVMVKPALAYLDVISQLHARSSVPIAAYQVSGEYQMIQLMVQNRLAEERGLILENLTAIRRAGAQILVTYFASRIAKEGWLR